MDLGTRLYTWLNGRQVGVDAFGNRYYEHRSRTRVDGRRKRWVLYRGMAEASKIPPEWHAWVHYTTDSVPDESGEHQFDWQRPHLPNLTGTRYAYRPPGHVLKGGRRDRATGDYQPWTPN